MYEDLKLVIRSKGLRKLLADKFYGLKSERLRGYNSEERYPSRYFESTPVFKYHSARGENTFYNSLFSKESQKDDKEPFKRDAYQKDFQEQRIGNGEEAIQSSEKEDMLEFTKRLDEDFKKLKIKSSPSGKNPERNRNYLHKNLLTQEMGLKSLQNPNDNARANYDDNNDLLKRKGIVNRENNRFRNYYNTIEDIDSVETIEIYPRKSNPLEPKLGSINTIPINSRETSYNNPSKDISKFPNKSQTAQAEEFTPIKGTQWEERVMCKKHPGYMVSYICLQDKCGEILCQTCKNEHQRRKHEGVYETLQNFKKNLSSRLNESCESLIESSYNIQELQAGMGDREKHYAEMGENILRLEEKVLTNVKEYFETLKQEFERLVTHDVKKVRNSLDDLHLTVENMINKLKKDILSLSARESPQKPLGVISKIVKESYMGHSQDFQTAIHEVQEKVQHFLEHQRKVSRKPRILIKVDENLYSNIFDFFAKRIQLIKPQSNKFRPSQETDRGRTRMKASARNRGTWQMNGHEEIRGYIDTKTDGLKVNGPTEGQESSQRSYESAKSNHIDEERKKRTLTPSVESNNENYRGVEKQRSYASEPRKTYPERNSNVGRKSDEGEYSKSKPEVEQGSRELDTKAMKFLVNHMSSVYESNKVKVFDYSFFEDLFQTSAPIDLNNLRKKRLYLENVREYMNTKGKERCVFTAYEKVLFLLNIETVGWTLIEVRKTPKMIILYDFLGKFINKSGENLIEKFFQVIKYEFRMRLNQDVDIQMWGRRVSKEPILFSKNLNDTGILVLEMVANAFQDKDNMKGKVSMEVIKRMRRNVEQIFQAFERKSL